MEGDGKWWYENGAMKTEVIYENGRLLVNFLFFSRGEVCNCAVCGYLKT
ncbi:hypothetical protein [Niastella populi]